MKRSFFVIAVILLFANATFAYDGGYMIFSYQIFDEYQTIYPTYSYFTATYEDEVTNYFDPYIDESIPYDTIHPFELVYPSSYNYTLVNVRDSNEQKKLISDLRPAEQEFRQFRVRIGLYCDEIESPPDPPARFMFSFMPGSFQNMNVYAYCDSFYHGRLYCLNEYKDDPVNHYISMTAPPPPETVAGNPHSGVYFYCKEQIAAVTIIICDDANSIKEAMYDFNNDGIVDWKDFCSLAGEWCNTQGKYRCDTTGAEGKPDGLVNELELVEMSKYWLCDRADLFKDGTIDLKDYAVLAKNWFKMTREANINGPANLPSERVNFYDIDLLVKRMK